MRVVIQKVKSATLFSNGEKYSEISSGILILFGVSVNDKIENTKALAEKILKLRIFEDENGKINKNIFDAGGEIMVVSNFTLYGNLKGTNRPDFDFSARAEIAEPIYNAFCAELEKSLPIKTGVFKTDMQIEVVLDGPNTYIYEMWLSLIIVISKKLHKKTQKILKKSIKNAKKKHFFY